MPTQDNKYSTLPATDITEFNSESYEKMKKLVGGKLDFDEVVKQTFETLKSNLIKAIDEKQIKDYVSLEMAKARWAKARIEPIIYS